MSSGQLRVLWARQSLTPELIARLTPDEQRALERLRRARSFGESLGLRKSSGYRHLLDIPPEEAVRVVVAAPPDRLEPVTWWFPIVGRIAYRGYFDAAMAREFAAGLAERGLDTYVRPAIQYSTLGFFDDPIPRPLLQWPAVDVIDTAIHELVHETVFVAGDTAYNEGLASFIAREATRRLLADEPELRARARDAYADRREFAALLQALEAELTVLYTETSNPDEARARRAAVFRRYQLEEFRARDWRTDRYAGFPEQALSNAYLVAHRTYRGDLPCFEAELGALDGDLAALIRRHRERPGHRDCEPPR